MRKSWSEKKLTERGRIFLSASLGEISVKEACKKLGITRQRFYELEERAMRGFFKALEPKAPGRPAKEKDPTEPLAKKMGELEKENKKLWLYVKVLRGMAGIEEGKKKRPRSAKGNRGGD
jgi:hypothetical protein